LVGTSMYAQKTGCKRCYQGNLTFIRIGYPGHRPVWRGNKAGTRKLPT
jgi:hypothetical protein